MARKGDRLLWTVVIVLVLLWAVGRSTENSLGGLINLLLVIAVVVILIRFIQGRRVL